MENSAKALLIAGSILLFILLSTFAMYVFSRTRNHTNDIYNLMLTSEVDGYNQKFIKYEDRELQIQDVVSIINLAKDYNRKQRLPVELNVTAESGIINGISEKNLLSDKIDINNVLKDNIEEKFKCITQFADNSNLIENIIIEKYE